MTKQTDNSPFEAMDRMYRVQRHFYDLTRKYYLLGRDELLERLDPQPVERIIEIGCGTGRNLIKLARANPTADFFGIDASAAMLDTAINNARKANVNNVQFATALAEDLDGSILFGVEQLFDKAFFSYSISMIPSWQLSLVQTLQNLKPNGILFLVDFFDQNGLPRPVGMLLRKWLSLFGVYFPAELPAFLRELEASGTGHLKFESLYRGYSFLAEFRKD